MARLRVRELADKKGMNANQLALAAGLTYPMVRRYWDNDTKMVTLNALEKLANALGVSIGDLFTDEEDEHADSPLARAG